jgi:hypothetical protein
VTERIAIDCGLAHELLRSLPVHGFPFDSKSIPLNGLYVLFEKGEEGHDGARIVRVGTHTGQRQLRSRLAQHFLKENKDRSIFRKNIGRCLLRRDNDNYAAMWESDLTTNAARLAPPEGYDHQRQLMIEQDVSRYIRNSFFFVVLGVAEKEDRLRIEAGLTSLVSLCPKCRPSSNWLGNYSPKERIRESGLWQVNELYKVPITTAEIHAVIDNAFEPRPVNIGPDECA